MTPQRQKILFAGHSLLNGLISFWKLDEASGVARDSVGSNHLSATNNPVSAAGRIGKARLFVAASNQALEGIDDFRIPRGANARFTISTWVNFTTITGDGNTYVGILSKGAADTSGGEFALNYRIAPTNLFRFRVRGTDNVVSGVAQPAAPSPALTATWYHVLAWYDGAAIKARVNMGTPASAAHTTGIFAGTNPFRIGRMGASTTDDMDGSVDETGIWNRVLSEAEMAYLYNSGFGKTYPFV